MFITAVLIFVAKRKEALTRTLIFLNQKNQHCFGYCLSTIVTNYFHDVEKVLRLILQRFCLLQMFSLTCIVYHFLRRLPPVTRTSFQ